MKKDDYSSRLIAGRTPELLKFTEIGKSSKKYPKNIDYYDNEPEVESANSYNRWREDVGSI